jgi:hypothetical protein
VHVHVQIQSKKRNRLEHRRLSNLVYMSYNRKMENWFANIREIGSKGKKSNPLVLEEFLWENEWVEDSHEDDGANIWIAIDDAFSATHGLSRPHFTVATGLIWLVAIVTMCHRSDGRP